MGHWALKNWMFERKVTNRSRSNFCLQKWKMAEYKYHYIIHKQYKIFRWMFWCSAFMPVLFWVNARIYIKIHWQLPLFPLVILVKKQVHVRFRENKQTKSENISSISCDSFTLNFRLAKLTKDWRFQKRRGCYYMATAIAK